MPNRKSPNSSESRTSFGVQATLISLRQGEFLYCGGLFYKHKMKSSHALLIYPAASTALDAATRAAISRWKSNMAHPREIFFLRDGKVSYAGTYNCHSGPLGVSLSQLGMEGDTAKVCASLPVAIKFVMTLPESDVRYAPVALGRRRIQASSHEQIAVLFRTAEGERPWPSVRWIQ